MLAFPNCKINLGLSILNKRDDGFHNLETVFYPIPFKDSLEIITDPNQHNNSSSISFSQTGLTIDGDSNNNLCVKAFHLLKKDFDLPAVKMHLHKAIPMGAGLGGGSADGAFTLKLLNQKFNLNLSNTQLVDYALQLGSDCPFFILNKPCFATSRGEKMTEIPLTLNGYEIILINPGIHINTGWAFSQLKPKVPEKSVQQIIEQPISSWKNELVNDFEKPVFEKYPAVQQIRDELYKQGAAYASMSGSGSTVFGIFEPGKMAYIEKNMGYLSYITTLKA